MANRKPKRRSGRKPYGWYADEAAVVEVIGLKRRRRKGSDAETPYAVIARELNEEGYRTQTGKRWSDVQVRRILNRTPVERPGRAAKKTALGPTDWLAEKDIARGMRELTGQLWMLFVVLVNTGLRAAELCGLQIRDVSTQRRMVAVRRGKGAKTRTVVIHEKVAQVIAVQIRARQDAGAGPRDALFVNRAGRPMRTWDLAYRVRRMGEILGLNWLHPHVFRHTFAMQLYNYNFDILTVAEQLGHADISTTHIYAKSRPHNKLRQTEAFGPLFADGSEWKNLLKITSESVRRTQTAKTVNTYGEKP